MAAEPDGSTVVKDQDPVTAHYRRRPLRNDDRRVRPIQRSDISSDFKIGPVIEGRKTVVEYQKRWSAQKRSGNRQTLFLSAGKV